MIGGEAAMNREMSEIVRHQKPLTLPPGTTVQDACKRMHARKVGAVLVINERSRLLGIFTGRDAVRVLAKGRDPAATVLKDVMTKKPACMPPHSTAIEALRLMRDGGFRHVPVVQEGVVIGIVSRGDFRGLEQDRLDEETGVWERMR
jgi:CBS domain-containing protein